MKNKTILIFLIFMIQINCFEVPPNLRNVCPKGCKRYYNCDEVQKKCVFKGFFPVYPFELLEIVILMISSSLATSCGIGGGAVYSAMIIGVEEMEPNEAMPISNFLILLCGLSTFVSFTLDKYEHPKNKFVHYDIAIIFGPSMLIGAKFGTILNKILSSLLLLILLLIVVCYTLKKTYKNILKQKEKEKKLDEQNLLKANDKELGQPLINKEEMDELKNGLLQKDKNEIIINDEDEEIIKEDDNPLNWGRINFILLMEAIVIIDQLIEGSSKVPSFVGIRKCSMYYWLCFAIYVLITLCFIKVAIDKVSSHIKRKKELIPNYNSEVIENVEKNVSYVVFIGIVAGIVSSSIGIGGGMITNPVFSSLGMDPKQSSSTSNFLIIVTAIASCFIFITSGQLDFGYSICLGILCTLAALVGSFLILKYINRTGRSSILLVVMEFFLLGSLLIAILKIFTYDTKGLGFIHSLLVINPFCT